MLGHIAQASWHLQLALAYCPDTSERRADIDELVRLMMVLAKPLGGLFKFIPAYCQDDNITCNFVPELHLALVHLRMALSAGNEAQLRHGKLPKPDVLVLHRDAGWPVLFKDLCAVISRLESSVSALKVLDSDIKRYNRRVKKRSNVTHRRQLLQAVRRGEKTFLACQKAE